MLTFYVPLANLTDLSVAVGILAGEFGHNHFCSFESLMKKTLYLSLASLLLISACHTPMTKVDPTIPGSDFETAAEAGKQGTTGGAPSGQVENKPTGQDQQSAYLDMPETQGVNQDIVTTDEILPSMNYVNDRILAYGQKLDRWRQLDKQSGALTMSQQDTEQMVDCFRKLQRVLTGYTSLREKTLQQGMPSQDKKDALAVAQELQKSDIDFLEGSCGRLLASPEEGGGMQGPSVVGLTDVESMIEEHAANYDYDSIVAAWQKIPVDRVDRLGLRTKVHYGNALIYTHQDPQAIETYQKIVDQMSATDQQSTDLISLRKVLADLYTASGNYPAAKMQYQKISDDYKKMGKIEDWSKLQLAILDNSKQDSPELAEYASLMKNFLGYIPEKDGYKVVWQADKFLQTYPYSAVTANVAIIKTQAQEQAEKWLNSFVDAVDRLAAEKKYKDAMTMLEQVPQDIVDPAKKGTLQAKNDEIVLAEAVDRETEKLAKTQELQRKWNSGMLLVKAERYDEAITLFQEMQDTEYADRARTKVGEISLQAAQADRRKAADLFIRYTKTADVESKKKLLIESRRLLKDILVKYPDVEISEKVAGNIERVEQEMKVLDPNLLLQADAAPGTPLNSTAPEIAPTEAPAPATGEPPPPVVEGNLPQ